MKNKIILVICCICLTIILLFNFINNREYKQYSLDIEQNDNVNNPIDYEEIIGSLRIEYNNDDVVGILEINNTDYIVPIMQGK